MQHLKSNLPTTDPQDEIFPVVNERGEVIGKTTRREAHSNPAIIHPAIGIFVFSPRGEVLLQKRSATKDLGPNCWTLSVGGHIGYGTTPIETAIREASEEIGIAIEPEQLTLLGELVSKTAEETEYWYVYRCDLTREVELVPNPQEVAELRFVSLDELRRMISDPAIEWSEDPKMLIQKFILNN